MRPTTLALALAVPALLALTLARPASAHVAECRRVETCCTDLYEEMQASGLTVPAVNQCDFAYLVDEQGGAAGTCREVWMAYSEFSYSLFENGAIMAVPPSCTYFEPFTIEPGPGEPGADDWTIEPTPEDEDWTIEPTPEDEDWSIEPGPEDPAPGSDDWTMESEPPDWTMESEPGDPAPGDGDFEMIHEP